jgi:hypothetical protein
MKKRSFILLLVSVVFIFLFFQAPVNNTWLTARIEPYYKSFQVEKKHMSLEDRRTYKYKGPYILLTQITKFLSTHNAHNPVILLPPNSYIKTQHVDLRVPEPVAVYYYTGLHAVWTDSPNVDSADWAIIVEKGKVNLAHLAGREQLHQLLAMYKNYPPAL